MERSSTGRLNELFSVSLVEVFEDNNDQPLTEYAGRPAAFFKDIWDITLWGKQQHILYKLLGPNGCDFVVPELEGLVPPDGFEEVWVAAGHGVGKTFFAALLAEYKFSALGHCVFSSAPTGNQVHDLLWQQGIATNRMRAEQRGYKLPGRLLETDIIKVSGRPDWWAKGRSTDRPERMQGRHMDNLLILLDEVAGMVRPIINALKGFFTNPGVKMLGIGNPNADLTSPFAEACHERRGEVGVVEIDCHECPFVPQTWIDARKKEWGEKSLEYITKVLGRWPADSEKKAIPWDWILAARDFWYDPRHSEEEERIRCLGLDVAREGDDQNSLSYLKGQRIYIWRYWKQPRTDRTAREVFNDIRGLRLKPRALCVDANAVGGGVVDNLMALWETEHYAVGDCELVPVDWSGSANDVEFQDPDGTVRRIKQYHRKIAELYWKLRERFNPEADPETRWALPPDEVLQAMGIPLTFDQIAAQLNARKYWVNDYNLIQLESKKELRKRKISSPDVGDSIALLCAEPEEDQAQGFFL